MHFVQKHAEPKVAKVAQVTVRQQRGIRTATGMSMSGHLRSLADSFLNHKQVCKRVVTRARTETVEDKTVITHETEIVDGCLIGKLCDKGRALQKAYTEARDKE